MDPPGKVGVNCFRTYNELTMNLLGKLPLAPSVITLALFLFSPRVSCLVLASSLSSSRSRHVLPLVFGSPLEGLTARVDPPSLQLPAGSTSQTSSEQITRCQGHSGLIWSQPQTSDSVRFVCPKSQATDYSMRIASYLCSNDWEGGS